VKYDEWGNMLWVKQAGFGQNSINQGTSVATDNSGNIFITGTFGDTISFGTTQLVCSLTTNGRHIFLAKYNSSGNVLWAKQMGGGWDDKARSVSTDGFGNCYVAGDYQGSANDTFGNFILNNSDPSHHNMFIAKFDLSGNAVWARMATGSSGNIIGYSVKGDNAGNCYLVGGSEGAFDIDFGTNSLPCNNYRYTAFLVKYDANGYLLWARGSSGTAETVPQSVSLDPSGNIFMTGYFFGYAYTDSVLTFGSLVLNNSSHSTNVFDVFLVKYDQSGTPIWAKSEGGLIYNDIGSSVFADAAGNSYITGSFETPTISFGSFVLNGNGLRNLFLVKYGPGGNVHWAINVPSNSFDEGNSVAVDTAGNCFVAGEFSSPTIAFDSNLLAGTGLGDQMFIAKTSFFPLGINSEEQSSIIFSISPNPFNSSTTIRFNSQLKNGEVELFNLYGQEIKSIKNISADKIEIERGDLSDGIYFIRLSEENKLIATEKVIIAD
ncbi:MAG TPA: SBBP repeat-containing protein, partial [Bacteroidia bacterium]|nr:SBBP repeat-containing protein [Bacteroidia bacterium]